MWQMGRTNGGTALRRAALLACVLLTANLAAGARASWQDARQEGTGTRDPVGQTQAQTLEPGSAFERAMAGGEVHAYQLRLDAGQFAHVLIDQRGIDVAVKVFGPDGGQVAEVDGPSGMRGPEAVYLLPAAAGLYRMELRALVEKAAPGSYEVRLMEMRPATARERNLVAAQRAYAEGDRARSQGTKESRREAIGKYEEARALFSTAGDRFGEANALHNMGYMYVTLGESQRGLDYYRQALALRRAAGDRSGEAYTLTNIGAAYDSIGEKQKALEYFGQSLPIWKAVGDPLGEAAALANTGAVYSFLGEPRKALDYYHRALPLRRATGDRGGEASTLTNIGVAHSALGEMQRALDYYHQALPIWKAGGERRGEAFALTNMGVAYAMLGESQRALDYHQQALALRRAAGDRPAEASTLNNIGMVYFSIGEGQKAREYYDLALALRRAVGDRRGQAYTLKNLGVVYQSLGGRQEALEYFDQALALHRDVGDRSGEANTLMSIGVVYYSLGEWPKALDYFNQALPLSKAAGNRIWEATTLVHLARLERDRGNFAAARKLMSDALPLVESIRANVASQDLRASFFSTVRDYYELYIDILMRSHESEPSAGHAAQALQISERARARSLLDLLAEAGTDIRQGVAPRLAERENSLRHQLNSKLEYQIRLLSTKHTPEQAAAVSAATAALTAELEEVQGRIRSTSPAYAALTQPQPSTLREIQQQVLDPETLLLEYALGEERSYLWLVSHTSLSSFILPKRAEIEAAAVTLTRLVSEGGTPEEFDRQAAALSRLLLAPVAPHLGRKRLVIVAEGALQYVPFAALPRPSLPGRTSAPAPLVATHEIVSLPSASTLVSLRRQVAGRRPPAKRLAVFADPVFTRDDARIKAGPATARASSEPPAEGEAQRVAETARQEHARAADAAHSLGLRRAGVDLRRLPFSRHEAQRLLALVPRREALAALDFKASQATAVSPELRDYRIVHFATHGYLNTERPELSGLVLSLVDERGEPQDGFLSLSEIYNLHLSADLVVLSGCETGLGKQVRGEGLVGLTRGFMYAGAPRVVASLWAVQDRAAADMMGRLYEAMLRRGERPAAALRAAQLAMRREERWSAPHLWAGFIIQGEWR